MAKHFRPNNGYSPYNKLKIREQEEQQDAKAAMLEYNKEKSQAIDRTITTKPALNNYTDAELVLLSGEVLSYKINQRLDVGVFKKLSDESKIRYLQLLRDYYKELSVRNVAAALHISGSDAVHWLKRADIYSEIKGRRINRELSQKFKDDMGLDFTPNKKRNNLPAPVVAAPVVEAEVVEIKTEEPKPQPLAPKEPKWLDCEEKVGASVDLSYLTLECEAPDLLLALSTLPLRGKYQVIIKRSKEREVC